MESILFYGLTLVEIVFLFICLVNADDEQSWFLVTVLTIVGAVLAFVATKTNPIEWFQTNISGIITIAVIWPIVGGFWALLKWYAYTRSEKFQEITAINYSNWKKRGPERGEFEVPHVLTVSKNKAKIVNWIVWWPFSLVNACTFRFISNISSWVYSLIANVLQSFVNSSVSSIIKKVDSK